MMEPSRIPASSSSAASAIVRRLAVVVSSPERTAPSASE